MNRFRSYLNFPTVCKTYIPNGAVVPWTLWVPERVKRGKPLNTTYMNKIQYNTTVTKVLARKGKVAFVYAVFQPIKT